MKRTKIRAFRNVYVRHQCGRIYWKVRIWASAGNLQSTKRWNETARSIVGLSYSDCKSFFAYPPRYDQDSLTRINWRDPVYLGQDLFWTKDLSMNGLIGSIRCSLLGFVDIDFELTTLRNIFNGQPQFADAVVFALGKNIVSCSHSKRFFLYILEFRLSYNIIWQVIAWCVPVAVDVFIFEIVRVYWIPFQIQVRITRITPENYYKDSVLSKLNLVKKQFILSKASVI